MKRMVTKQELDSKYLNTPKLLNFGEISGTTYVLDSAFNLTKNAMYIVRVSSDADDVHTCIVLNKGESVDYVQAGETLISIDFSSKTITNADDASLNIIEIYEV